MFSSKAVRLVAVAAMIVTAGGIGLAAPASACACGGVAAPAGATATVGNEVALLGWDGTTETIVMQLALRSGGDHAALIVPTPAPATVTAADAAVFTELRERTAPEVVTKHRWFEETADGSMGGAPGRAAPTVLDRVQLGPLEATTLTGGDISGIQAWLDENGYVMRAEVVATMAPYLAEGWSFVAMRLTGTAALSGDLDPVQLSFPADRLVYPMRMSSAATSVQTVRLYVLGEHRVQRSDPDRGKQQVNVEFAGRVTELDDPALRELAANGRDYLTELSVVIPKPAEITSDFALTATEDKDYRRVVHRTETLEFLGFPAGSAALAAGLLVTVGVLLAVVVRVARR
ncbi:DUF2330 domain-containing protein [Nocardia sp. NPDC057668]|uniref:DUF2330 domain-containing protein n=1 Tax=Nocardia sp. NPDC057668 TaxID=3346202 RepID=UPI00366C535D